MLEIASTVLDSELFGPKVTESTVSPTLHSLYGVFIDVACADLAGGKVIKFGIELKRSCAETSTETFRKHLVEAMREMRIVCEQGQVIEAPVAHL